MAEFHRLNIPPPGVVREPAPPAQRLPISLKRELYSLFKEELLRPKSPLNAMLISIPGFQPRPMYLQRVGSTSLVARWMRGVEPVAITLLLSGIDRREDDDAVSAMSREIVGDSELVAVRFRPVIEGITGKPRPLAATVHLDEASYDDQGTRVSFLTLAEAFF